MNLCPCMTCQLLVWVCWDKSNSSLPLSFDGDNLKSGCLSNDYVFSHSDLMKLKDLLTVVCAGTLTIFMTDFGCPTMSRYLEKLWSLPQMMSFHRHLLHRTFSPPSTVLQTARTCPSNQTMSICFSFTVSGGPYYLALYFAEVQPLAATDLRIFDISLDGIKFEPNFNPSGFTNSSLYSAYELNDSLYNSSRLSICWSFQSTNVSTLGPLLNAAELFQETAAVSISNTNNTDGKEFCMTTLNLVGLLTLMSRNLTYNRAVDLLRVSLVIPKFVPCNNWNDLAVLFHFDERPSIEPCIIENLRIKGFKRK